MADLQNYKCPCCGGAIEFSSKAGKMKCPYCDTEFEMEAFADEYQKQQEVQPDAMEWQTAAGGKWQEGEQEGLRIYSCNSCGGEIVADENTAATSCPFCGNPVVMTGQLSGDLKPDYVIPFKYDKKAAMEALKKHYGGKKLLPKIFTKQNHIEEIKGIYVPFWLFDADAEADITYKATRVSHWRDSEYSYTDTRYYAVHRSGKIGFERVPVDGSSKIEDDLMESIEPFDFSEAVDFQTAYLAGYLADKYDVDSEQSVQRANERIKTSTEQAFAATVKGYATVFPQRSSVALKNGKAQYALYPVWLLNTSWNGERYFFAMNGQTGKFVGNLPMDKSALTRWFFGVFGAVAAGAFALSFLLWLL